MMETDKKELERYIPTIAFLDAENMAYILAKSSQINRLRNEAYKSMMDDLHESFERWKLDAHSNNWFKMHGYPMRRKRRKGSKKS